MSRRRGPKRAESHVRLYRHELESAAYRSLSCEARALLVEARSLFSGGENRIHLSIRKTQRRLGVGRHLAEKALAELQDRGFIRLLQKGGFNRKVRHSSEFALTNEPLADRDGAVPSKDFLRWTPAEKKITVPLSSTDGAGQQHRGPSGLPQKPPHGADQQHRKPCFGHIHGAAHQHTDSLPATAILSGGAGAAFGWWRMALWQRPEEQLKACLAMVTLSNSQEAAA
ncbi:hypothetical protein BJI67_05400 [Acidihalobacter aeolianus]|uniref:Uncharacterized protein n=1 Tax=Acidihalobacter aeolianus TaxID=2792603 RepID=A0A1D8K6P8_9GAMM|nr:hypothetical protein [Acidihalobacter aeolianus]AOV16580.1 hypothetical protein BJI67_05400 [Acidihalobacter aeolianus]